MIAPSSPAMMEPTPMIVPVPIITPSTVRNERSLCSRTVARASPTPDAQSQPIVMYSALNASIGSSFAARCAG